MGRNVRLFKPPAKARSEHDLPVNVALSNGNGGFTVQDERGAYVVLDVYATWRPDVIDGLRLDLGVDNVFDETYERTFAGVIEPGTNFKIAASWQFGG